MQHGSSSTSKRSLVIGTRKSKLALIQTEHVKQMLQKAFPDLEVSTKLIETQGDKSQHRDDPLPSIGGKGLFTAELESALLSGDIDLAVHSLKDLPTQLEPQFTIGAVCEREGVADVLISKSGKSLQDLAPQSIVGTSSLRREAQVRMLRPDLRVTSIRGNVDTRISKLLAPGMNYDAIVLAQAGIARLGRGGEVTQIFHPKELVPAAGQGALGIECRNGDRAVLDILQAINHEPTAAEVALERAFLETLNAGCNTPLGCMAEVQGDTINAFARALSRDGSRSLEVEDSGSASQAAEIGRRMGKEMLDRGIRNLEL